MSQANEWEDYSNYSREGGRDFQGLGQCPLFGLYGHHQDCHAASHGAGRCLI